MSEFRTLTIIRDWQDCRGPVKRGPTLVQVPGAWVPAVLSLVKLSEEHRHNGLIVTNIGPDTPAATAGMLRGDVLLRYDGSEVDSIVSLKTLTKRHSHGNDKTVRIEAARGAEDVHFEVKPGALGITVSPSLHRLKLAHVSPKAVKAQLSSPLDPSITLVSTLEQANKLDATHPALVEVPGELARTVLSLIKSVDAKGKRKKRAKALLTSAHS